MGDIFDQISHDRSNTTNMDFVPDQPAIGIHPVGYAVLLILVLSILALVVAAWRWRKIILKRKIIGCFFATVFIVMALNPPWRVTTKNSAGHTIRTQVEISWIFNDPTPAGQQYGFKSAQIATDIMSLEFLVWAAVGVTVHFLLPKPTV